MRHKRLWLELFLVVPGVRHVRPHLAQVRRLHSGTAAQRHNGVVGVVRRRWALARSSARLPGRPPTASRAGSLMEVVEWRQQGGIGMGVVSCRVVGVASIRDAIPGRWHWSVSE